MLGMTQVLLADLLGVPAQQVRLWESKDSDVEPDDDAWNYLVQLRERQIEEIDYAVDKVVEIMDERGEPFVVNLTYWESAAEYARAHADNPKHWQIANATLRIIAHEVEMLGCKVEFGFPGLREVLRRAGREDELDPRF